MGILGTVLGLNRKPAKPRERDFGDAAAQALTQGVVGLGAGAVGSLPALASLGGRGLEWAGRKTGFSPLETVGKGIADVSDYATPEALQGYAEKASDVLAPLGVPKDYLKPKTRMQKLFQEVGQEVGSIVSLGGGAKTIAKVAGVGNTLKQGALSMGLSENTANNIKLGGTLAAVAINPGGVGRAAKRWYKGVPKSITPTTSTLVQGSKEALKDTRSLVSKEIGQIKSLSSNIVEDASSVFKSKNTNVTKLWNLKKQLNEAIWSEGKKSPKLDKVLKPLERLVRGALDDYGVQNKEFGYALKNADTLHGIDKSMDIIKKLIPVTRKFGKFSDTTAKGLVHGAAFLIGGPTVWKALAGTQAAAAGAKSAVAMVKSPAYRKASVDLFKATMVSNANQAKKAFNTLNDLEAKAGVNDNVKHYSSKEELFKSRNERRSPAASQKPASGTNSADTSASSASPIKYYKTKEEALAARRKG